MLIFNQISRMKGHFCPFNRALIICWIFHFAFYPNENLLLADGHFMNKNNYYSHYYEPAGHCSQFEYDLEAVVPHKTLINAAAHQPGQEQQNDSSYYGLKRIFLKVSCYLLTGSAFFFFGNDQCDLLLAELTVEVSIVPLASVDVVVRGPRQQACLMDVFGMAAAVAVELGGEDGLEADAAFGGGGERQADQRSAD